MTSATEAPVAGAFLEEPFRQLVGAARACSDDAVADEFDASVANMRFAKPLDEALIDTLVQNHDLLITIEEGSIGGFGSFVLEYLSRTDQLGACRIRTMHLPDLFQDQDAPDKQYAEAGLDVEEILKVINK